MFHRATGVRRGLNSISSINILFGFKTGHSYSGNKEGRLYSNIASSLKMLNSSRYV